MKLKSIIFQQDIYLEELAELQNLLCKKDENKNVIALISRIAVGLKDSASQFTKMIDKLYAEMI
jgi:carbamate kinase